jgi:hypothetical protein
MGSMRLRHNVDYTVETLTRVKSDLGTTGGGGQSPSIRRDAWLRWWSAADAQLRNLFTDGDLAASLAVSADKVRDVNLDALPFMVLNRESDVWDERLGQVIDALKALKPFIERPGVIIVPDTSAFLEGEYFTDLDWQALAGTAEPVRLVVPVLVVEELDAHKRGRDRQRDRAVSVLRRLWELGGSAPEQVAVIPGRRVTVEVFLDGPWHARRPVNDDEIIERAVAAGEITGREVLLAAADFAMLYRAAAAGLKAVLVPRPGEEHAEPARPLPAPGGRTVKTAESWPGLIRHHANKTSNPAQITNLYRFHIRLDSLICSDARLTRNGRLYGGPHGTSRSGQPRALPSHRRSPHHRGVPRQPGRPSGHRPGHDEDRNARR